MPDTNTITLGGRHNNPPPSTGGGGYLDICRILATADRPIQKIFEKKIEVTITDLKTIGLSGKWLEIAEKVGVETWLEIWQILDRENINQPVNMRDALRVRIPAYSRLMKFARNKYIEEFTEQGLDAKKIYDLLIRAQIEPVCVKWIQSIQSAIRRRKNTQ